MCDYTPFGGTILSSTTEEGLILQVALTCVLSIASYHLIELRKQKRLISYIAANYAVVIIAAFLGTQFQQQAFSADQQKIFAAWEDRATYRCGKIFRMLNPSERICSISSATSLNAQAVLIVGNSHADSIKTSFNEVAEEQNFKTYFYVTNTPLMTKRKITSDEVITDALKISSKRIVLHFSPKGVDKDKLEDLIQKAEEHLILVTIIAPITTYSKHVPKALFAESIGEDDVLNKNIEDYEQENKAELTYLRNLLKNRIVETAPVFCTPTCRVINNDKELLYFDEGHLTLKGAKMLAAEYKQAL
ncbi:SGNH hydrolase domain-containing protein, partial [Oleiphilus sp. HI0125]